MPFLRILSIKKMNLANRQVLNILVWTIALKNPVQIHQFRLHSPANKMIKLEIENYLNKLKEAFGDHPQKWKKANL